MTDLFCHIINPSNPSFTKLVGSRIGWTSALFFFCIFSNLHFISVHKNRKKELGYYPATFTSWPITHLYIYSGYIMITIATDRWKAQRDLICNHMSFHSLSFPHRLITSNINSYHSLTCKFLAEGHNLHWTILKQTQI